MTTIHDLHQHQGQSIWFDSLSRSHLRTGLIDQLIAAGVRGLTSNPTLMVGAIGSDSAYDAEIHAGLESGLDPLDIYWRLTCADVASAAERFSPVYEASGGGDGFVSVEVAPDLAFSHADTVAAAVELRRRFEAPNVLIKIPATDQGVDAIEDVIAAGVGVNATLIFTLARYRQVLAAYANGIARLVGSDGDASKVASVASFFVSRTDSDIDARLEAMGDPEALELRGRAAVAQCQLAYEIHQAHLASPQWRALERHGARPQRLLWASTSRKNPAYDALVYVAPLVGPSTVNTMPEQTIRDLLAAGELERTVDRDPDEARTVARLLEARGIALEEVGAALEARGVELFAQSWAQIRATMETKARQFGSE